MVIEYLDNSNTQNKQLLDFVGILSEIVKKNNECVPPDGNTTHNIQQTVVDAVSRHLEKKK